MPSTLYATVTGGCPALNGSYPLRSNGTTWVGGIPGRNSLTLSCVNNTTWQISLTCASDSHNAFANSVTCNPLNLSFPNLGPFGACCPLNPTVSVTVTT